VRQSHNDAKLRFVIAIPVKVDGKWGPVIIGNGRDWKSALESASTSEGGKIAAEEWKKYIDSLKKDTNDDDHAGSKEAV
jgi:hypothetical protein